MSEKSTKISLPTLIGILLITVVTHFLIAWSAKKAVLGEIGTGNILAGIHIGAEGYNQYKAGNTEAGLRLLETSKLYGASFPFLILAEANILSQMDNIEVNEKTYNIINKIDVNYRDELILEAIYSLGNVELHNYLNHMKSIFAKEVPNYNPDGNDKHIQLRLLEQKTGLSNEGKKNLRTCLKRLNRYMSWNRYVAFHSLIPSNKACVDLFYQDKIVIKPGMMTKGENPLNK